MSIVIICPRICLWICPRFLYLPVSCKYITMFCPHSKEKLQKESLQTFVRLPHKKHHRRKKYNNKQGHKKQFKKENPFVYDMSQWAENFTVAATWQLKHQVAYWKARATALEHENSILHEIIRNNKKCIRPGITTEEENEMCHNIGISKNIQINQVGIDLNVYENGERMESGHGVNSVEDYDDDNDEDVVVSEEYIQYLAANAKYREDAKRERELLKAKEKALENDVTVQESNETAEEKRERLRELYGDQWQRISALEMTTMSNFLSECDRTKPVYWPNIPFNFNYS